MLELIGRITAVALVPFALLGWLTASAWFWFCIGWETARDMFSKALSAVAAKKKR